MFPGILKRFPHCDPVTRFLGNSLPTNTQLLEGPDTAGARCLLNVLLASDTQVLEGPDTAGVRCLLNMLLETYNLECLPECWRGIGEEHIVLPSQLNTRDGIKK